jgi:phage shock protein C
MENTKRLIRSTSERQIAGVCGGLAEYFNIDPTLVRLAFVVATLMGGPGLIVYIIMALVVPEDERKQVEY